MELWPGVRGPFRVGSEVEEGGGAVSSHDVCAVVRAFMCIGTLSFAELSSVSIARQKKRQRLSTMLQGSIYETMEKKP